VSRALLALSLLLASPALAAEDPVSQKFSRAEFYLGNGQAPEAVMELRAAAALLDKNDPRMLEYFTRLGMVYLDKHDLANAQEAFVSAIQTAENLSLSNSFLADAYAGIGFCLMEKARYTRAANFFRRGLDLGPSPEVRRRVEKGMSASLSRLGEDESSEEAGPVFQVGRIVFYGNRTDESLLRRHLPFTEGESIDARDLAVARGALYRMNLFKSVEVATASVTGIGTEVAITVKDGWYVIPFPVFAGGAGKGRGGLMIEERNAFYQAETITFAALTGPSGRRVALAGSEEGWSALISRERRSFTERLYADGAYSTTAGLSAPLDEDHVEGFGAVSNSYAKTSNDVVLSVEAPIIPYLWAEVGLHRAMVGYGAPTILGVPGDAGKEGTVFIGAKFGPGQNTEAGFGLGAILGFGLANLSERLRLQRERLFFSGGIRGSQARKWTASSFNYGVVVGQAQATYLSGRQGLTLAAAGGHGYNLPANKLLATGRLSALQGLYAREFRGDSVLGGSLAYGRRIWVTRMGFCQAEIFAELARAWTHDIGREKRGVGANLFYSFWRFPLPLGISYTYSLDDRNSQFSGAIGGRF